MVNRDLFLREVVSFLTVMNTHTHTGLEKRKSTLCSSLFPNNHFYVLPFDVVMRHKYLLPLFGRKKNKNNETTIFNSVEP